MQKNETVDQLPNYAALTRDGYDRTAAAYADRFHHHLDDKTVDQAVIHAFAGLVAKGVDRRILDIGCGTGATTALLAGCGLEVSGIDLSPGMVAQARRLNPSLQFNVGTMLDLKASSDSVGGVCAWYSIIHIPDEDLPEVLDEFHRVLVPGGLVLLAFQVGDQPRVLTDAFDQDVHLTFHRRQPQMLSELLVSKGFRMHTEVIRQPEDDGLESTPHAYLVARKAARC